MVLEYFDGQANFFADYKEAANEKDIDQQAVINKVMDQLNEAPEDEKLTFVLSGDQTKSGHSVTFPFRKELVARDPDAAVDTLFFYEGAPYEVDLVEDEQP
ncbi:hypothetical protein NRIC_37300 [Enterococcus florum]|uniref:Uncharacterized protein n=1 Tax=Enterococcus florum TaxID=2480627 RepID=A0A4V0WQ21_9ENTE|nr:hypothetical protein [Enterococcus florum]GCF95839.1 hypothetical protein NRIC_37300 [Enterococcus florum]